LTFLLVTVAAVGPTRLLEVHINDQKYELPARPGEEHVHEAQVLAFLESLRPPGDNGTLNESVVQVMVV
jgi:hypothetical protein